MAQPPDNFARSLSSRHLLPGSINSLAPTPAVSWIPEQGRDDSWCALAVSRADTPRHVKEPRERDRLNRAPASLRVRRSAAASLGWARRVGVWRRLGGGDDFRGPWLGTLALLHRVRFCTRRLPCIPSGSGLEISVSATRRTRRPARLGPDRVRQAPACRSRLVARISIARASMAPIRRLAALASAAIRSV